MPDTDSRRLIRRVVELGGEEVVTTHGRMAKR
jgi:hypothetical protein